MTDLVKELQCPVCKAGPMEYDDGTPKSDLPAPPVHQCRHCGTIIPARAATALDRPVDGEREKLIKDAEDTAEDLDNLSWAFPEDAPQQDILSDASKGMRSYASLLRTPPAEPSEARVASNLSDNLAINAFAAVMKEKMAKKASEGRGGWDGPTCNSTMLARMLVEHIAKGDPVDIGNFAMMLWNRQKELGDDASASLIAAGVTGRPGVEITDEQAQELMIALCAQFPSDMTGIRDYDTDIPAMKAFMREAIAKLLEPSA